MTVDAKALIRQQIKAAMASAIARYGEPGIASTDFYAISVAPAGITVEEYQDLLTGLQAEGLITEAMHHLRATPKLQYLIKVAQAAAKVSFPP